MRTDDAQATPENNRVRWTPLPYRHDQACPNHQWLDGAATGGPDKPGRDDGGESHHQRPLILTTERRRQPGE